jgi:GntR family transcriptional regulator
MQPQETAGERPIKVKIADEIRLRIERGELAPGDPIPTIQELTDRWRTSPRTARDAHTLLRQMGLVTGRRGSALRVRTPPRVTVRSSEHHQEEKDHVRLPEEERRAVGASEREMDTPLNGDGFTARYQQIPASAELAEVFGLGQGANLLQRTYEKTDHRSGARVAWSVSYIPVDLILGNPRLLDQNEEPWPGGTQHQLSTVGIEVMRVVDEVTTAMPTTAEQQAWELDDGVPLFKVRRISSDIEGRVVEVTDAIFAGDRTKLVFVTPLHKW